ncbi:MAG: phospholipid carrier-dependent glycosyltransferase [Anaerolineae bacterium]|nr:phospholipid carrier-dependent glycosyltransferase [Anaerolineae bacterium]
MRNKTLLIILTTYLVLAFAWNLIIPPYENLDELEHAEVVRHIAVTGKLPVHNAAEQAGYLVRQEASQPPLYHIAAALWSRMLHLSQEPHNPTPVPESLIACGLSDTFYNKATWVHPLDNRAFMSGPRQSILMLRVFSTLLQIITLMGVWTFAQRVFPDTIIPAFSTAMVAFNPQYLLVSTAVNNDNMMTPLAVWGLVGIFDLWEGYGSLRQHILLGVLCGLAALSKLSGIGFLALAGGVLLLQAIQQRASFIKLVIQGSAILIPALLLITPWLLRNFSLYNDPTALTPMLEKVGQRLNPASWGELRIMFLSYWGQLPCSFYPRFIYWPYIGLVIGGLAGLLWGWRKLSLRQKQMLGLCFIWLIVIVLAWIRWNNMTPAAGGRLLFPAISASAILLASGWSTLVPKTAKLWVGFLAVWAMVTLVSGPLLIFTPPPQMAAATNLPGTPGYTFSDRIKLTDYQVTVRHALLSCLFTASVYCNPVLDLTLNWQASQQLMKDYILVVQLVSPVVGDNSLRFNYNYWPGKGNYPTTQWQIDASVRDHYHFPLKQDQAPTGAWQATVAFMDPASDDRLPVLYNGQPVGDAAHLAILRVPGINPILPAWGNTSTPVIFGDAIILQDARITMTDTPGIAIDLFWESREVVSDNYTVFVHGYDQAGNLMMTGDSPPQNGGFPTSLWLPGDRIQDSHLLTGNSAGIITIQVGLYHPETGERMPALFKGERLPNHAVVIWRNKP